MQELRKIKITKGAGIEMSYDQVMEKDGTVSKMEHNVKSKKEEPHPDLKAALNAFESIVRYDEGYTKTTEMTVTGVTFFPSNDAWIITHTKQKQSGASSTNSGRIRLDSDDFKKAEDCQKAWERLETEAMAFLFENKRAQLSMAFSGEEEEKEVVADLKTA